MTAGSMFAGIGGFDLALERVGHEVCWQVEIDEFCRDVLAHHWPRVARYADVREIDPSELAPVDIMVGGFPCQPVSQAGKREGVHDERWLWPEFARIIRGVRPRYVLMENTPDLLVANNGRAFGDVLGDLAACGYGVAWDCLPASALGAPHRRDRVWILAVADTERDRLEGGESAGPASPTVRGAGQVADANGQRRRRGRLSESRRVERALRSFVDGCDALREFADVAAGQWRDDPAKAQPGMGRLAHGIPNHSHQLRALGNAIVPSVAEWILRRIDDAENGAY